MAKDETKELAKELGKRGGKKTLEKHGREHFVRISKLGKKALEEKRKNYGTNNNGSDKVRNDAPQSNEELLLSVWQVQKAIDLTPEQREKIIEHGAKIESVTWARRKLEEKIRNGDYMESAQLF